MVFNPTQTLLKHEIHKYILKCNQVPEKDLTRQVSLELAETRLKIHNSKIWQTKKYWRSHK